MYFICRTNGGAINLEVGSFLLPHTRSLGLGSPSNISQENENRFSPLESIYKTNDNTALYTLNYIHSQRPIAGKDRDPQRTDRLDNGTHKFSRSVYFCSCCC